MLLRRRNCVEAGGKLFHPWARWLMTEHLSSNKFAAPRKRDESFSWSIIVKAARGYYNICIIHEWWEMTIVGYIRVKFIIFLPESLGGEEVKSTNSSRTLERLLIKFLGAEDALMHSRVAEGIFCHTREQLKSDAKLPKIDLFRF